MRKTNSERKVKRLTNKLDKFYLYYSNCPRFRNEALSKTNSQIKDLSVRLKMAVELLYSELKVEKKYQYYINFYILYLIICRYFETNNELIEKFFKENKIKTFKALEIILPYESAFGTKIKNKATECANWLYYSLKKIIKDHVLPIKKENKEKLIDEIEDYDKEILNTLLQQYKDTEYFDEVRLLNHILARIQYARDNVEILYSYENTELDDKKLRTMIKGSLTRAEKLINMVVAEIEDACMVA